MVTGARILKEASILLQDEDFTRWTMAELIGWLNAGVAATILAKPSANSMARVLPLVPGSKQKIEQIDGGPRPLSLLSIDRNITAAGPPVIGGRMIKLTSRAILEAADPYWHDPRRSRFTKEAKHYTFDENLPLEFFVYPGNTGEGMVEAVVSAVPAPVVAIGDPAVIASYEGDIGLPEPYAGVVLDYVLFRAFSKDGLEGDMGRGQTHYAQFASAVGLKIQVERATSPNATRGAN